jgi:hypothetical protein
MAPRSPGAAAELSQIKENKRKEMKANFLSFPFICFSESGLFNGLQPIQIKKLFLISNLIAHIFAVYCSHVVASVVRAATFNFSTDFYFCKYESADF